MEKGISGEAPEIFAGSKSARESAERVQEAEKRAESMLKTIGQLTMERDYLMEAARLEWWHTKQCSLGVRGLRDKLRKEDGSLQQPYNPQPRPRQPVHQQRITLSTSRKTESVKAWTARHVG